MAIFPNYIENGYLLDKPPGALIPLPIAKVDSNGNQIPLSVKDIKAWQDNYLKEHPEIQAKLSSIEENKIKTIKRNSKTKHSLIERIIRAIIKRWT